MRSSSRNIAILSSEANIASLRSNEDTQCATSRVLISRFCVMRMTLLKHEDYQQFACKFSIKVHFFVFSMSDIKQLTNGIV